VTAIIPKITHPKNHHANAIVSAAARFLPAALRRMG
jgi:hypothetical protein